MSHQDWTPIIFNSSDVKNKEKKQISNRPPAEDTKMEPL